MCVVGWGGAAAVQYTHPKVVNHLVAGVILPGRLASECEGSVWFLVKVKKVSRAYWSCRRPWILDPCVKI